MIWACPPSHWVSWALFPFRLSHNFFFIFSPWNFSLAPSVGCDPSRFFFMKEKLFRLKKGLQGIYFLEGERNIKHSLSSFQTQAVRINKLWPRPIWWFGLCKEMHFMSLWAMSSLHTIIHTFKATCLKSHGVRTIFNFLFVHLEFSNLNEGVAWFMCHSTSRMSKISF